MPPVMTVPRADRVLRPEIMDGPLPYGEARRALRDLDRVNRWTLGLGALLRCLIPRLGRRGTTVRLLDVGTGTGYGAHRLARAAARRGIRLRTVGVDRRLAHLVVGRELHAETGLRHRVVASADALPFRAGAFHWTCSHLLFHHFDGRANRKIIEEMLRCARRGVAVIDLRRSVWAAFLARLLFPLLRIGHVAAEDGVLSIRQSWTVEEIHHLARESHWPVTELRNRFPFRWSLVLSHEEAP